MNTIAQDAPSNRHQKAAKIIVLGAIFNFFLATVKCVAGWLGHSSVLFADGVHSFSDLFTDVVVFVASKFGNAAADREHPYGHHRIETAGTIFVASFLLVAAIAIIMTGALHIIKPNPHNPIHPYVLWIAIFALIINESIYHVTVRIAKNIHSEMLRAHAWHRRSDAATSLIVLIGVVGTMLGFTFLDGSAAIIIGFFIAKMAWQKGHKSFEELIDRGLNQKQLAEIRSVIEAEPGVESLHQLRTRLMGEKVFADVHIIVHRHLSVSEGHYISENVLMQLQKKFPNLNDITIHIDSENDEFQHDAERLPSRQDILKLINQIHPKLPLHDQMQLKAIHYFGKKITLELMFPISSLAHYSKESLRAIYEEKITAAFHHPIEIKMYFY